MKSRFAKVIILALVLILTLGSLGVFAYEPYETYTYSIDGFALKSPTAYSAKDVLTDVDLKINRIDAKKAKLSNTASDIATDADGNVYIADTGNDRIVILDKYYKAKELVSAYVNEFGEECTIKAPEGVYIATEGEGADAKKTLYVCDTGNAQIVVFEYIGGRYEYSRTITKPVSPLLEKVVFQPQKIAVDKYGRIFVVSSTITDGVVVMSSKGDFTGFIGAQKVSGTVWERIWARFQSIEERANSIKKIAYPYNSITVDDDGFIYVTTSGIPAANQMASLEGKTADYSPVKKLNSTGVEIMKRNGFFDPAGEVDVYYPEDVSKITDITLGQQGTWTILDSKRSRFFTYDQDGNLLFAFGGKGEQLGQGEDVRGVTYQLVDGVYYLVSLDKTTAGTKLCVYSPTEYCDSIMEAIKNQNSHNHSVAIDCWEKVLTKNNNFDLAYIGIGKALFNLDRYEEAQDMLKKAYEVDYASKAFAEMRKEIIGKYVLLLVAAIIVLVVLFSKFLGYAKKKNKATTLKVGRKTYWEELLFAFHLVFHPFDGFWDLKHEKRGSVRAATTILGLTVVALFYNMIGKGYLFNPRGTTSSILVALISVAFPVILFAVANWCLTTLFEGEGSFKDIYIATCYALAPLPLFLILSTILSNVLTSTEGSIVSLIVTLGLVWTVLLLFFGVMVTQDYSMGKNFITILGTIVAMAVIIFVGVLFVSLMVKMITFLVALFTEIGTRI